MLFLSMYLKTMALNNILRFNAELILLMSKKTVIVMALILIFLVDSAIAIPKTKEPKPPKPPKPVKPNTETESFTELATLTAGDVYLGSQVIDNGILYVQDAISTGTVNSGDSPISGFGIHTRLSGTLDLDTYLGSYAGEWIINGNGGTFEGTITGKVEVANIFGKFVAHGTDDFEGQKIKGDFVGSVNNYQIEITIQAIITSKIK
jgi:hypothetical protein